jgi:hypothetical protein
VRESKIGEDVLKHEAKFRILSWGTVLLLLAVSVSLFALDVSGVLSAHSKLGFVFVFTLLSAIIGACILGCREALNCAERQMIFVLDDRGIVRKRPGFPEETITFSEIGALSEELGWLVIYSREPLKKIAIPKKVKGYEEIRAELTKHHSISQMSVLAYIRNYYFGHSADSQR